LNIIEILNEATNKLSDIVEQPRLEAQILLGHLSGLTLPKLIAFPEREVSNATQAMLLTFIKRRAHGEPLAYLVGYKEFWSLSLQVTPATLIPRPETEHLVEWALQHLPAQEPLQVADLGTGSGAIALALASERPQWLLYATDYSEKALAVARDNAKRLQISNIHFAQGDWCAALPKVKLDAIVSNPPYLQPDDPHLKSLRYEPSSALTCGKAGLGAIESIATSARHYLHPEAPLIIEHGYQQQPAVVDILQRLQYKNITCHSDYAKLPRFVTAINTAY